MQTVTEPIKLKTKKQTTSKIERRGGEIYHGCNHSERCDICPDIG